MLEIFGGPENSGEKGLIAMGSRKKEEEKLMK
jgi:hypothetical protein